MSSDTNIKNTHQQSNQSIRNHGTFELGKIHHNIILYLLLVLSTLQIAFDNIVFYSDATVEVKIIMAHIFCLQNIIILIANIINFSNFKTALQYVFLIDPIFLATIGSALIVGTGYGFVAKKWYEIIYIPFYLIMVLLFSGCVRLVIKLARWSKVHIIIFKISLFCGAMFYLSLGCYIYLVDYKLTKGFDSNLDDIASNFTSLYSGINFGFYFELYNKLSDFDGSADLKWNYQIRSDDDKEQNSALNHEHTQTRKIMMKQIPT